MKHGGARANLVDARPAVLRQGRDDDRAREQVGRMRGDEAQHLGSAHLGEDEVEHECIERVRREQRDGAPAVCGRHGPSGQHPYDDFQQIPDGSIPIDDEHITGIGHGCLREAQKYSMRRSVWLSPVLGTVLGAEC